MTSVTPCSELCSPGKGTSYNCDVTGSPRTEPPEVRDLDTVGVGWSMGERTSGSACHRRRRLGPIFSAPVRHFQDAHRLQERFAPSPTPVDLASHEIMANLYNGMERRTELDPPVDLRQRLGGPVAFALQPRSRLTADQAMRGAYTGVLCAAVPSPHRRGRSGPFHVDAQRLGKARPADWLRAL